MPVIGIVNQKGGCGKSTAACHLAYWFSLQGKTVVTVDADAQQSASRWLSRLKNPLPTAVTNNPSEIMDMLPAFAKQYDFVVVDGAGGLTETTRCIMLRSDLVVLPVQPTCLDSESATVALKSIGEAQSVRNGAPKAVVLISRAERRTTLTKETRLLFQEEAMRRLAKFDLLETVIQNRQVVADCFGQDAVIWTMPASRAKASLQEFNELCQEIYKHATQEVEGSDSRAATRRSKSR